MPGSKDFAALPTSLALTLWDTAPLFLSLEAAFAILTIALLSGPWRSAIWSRRTIASPGGVAVLALTSLPLAGIYAVAAFAASFLPTGENSALALDGSSTANRPPPDSPLKALTAHLGDVLVPLFLAAGVAACVKVVLDPSSDWPGVVWIVLAIPTALLVPGGAGPASIAATGFSFSPGGLAAAGTLVVTSTLATAYRNRSSTSQPSAPEPAEVR